MELASGDKSVSLTKKKRGLCEGCGEQSYQVPSTKRSLEKLKYNKAREKTTRNGQG